MPENDILLLKIRGLLPSLNPALKKIALYILNNPQKVKLLRIKDLASNCGVAEATVTRFVKTISLGSFQELKINIAEITKERKVEEDLAIGIYNSRAAQMIIIDILYAGLAIRTFDTAIKKIERSSASLRNVLM